MSLPNIQEGTGRRQFSDRGDSWSKEETAFIEEGDREREPFIEVGKKYLTHGRRPFIGRGGCPSREGGSRSSQVGEGRVSWYELDLSWCGGKEQELGIFTLNLIT